MLAYNNNQVGDSLMNMQQPFDMAAVQAIINSHLTLPGALLPILHAVQV